MCGLRSSIVRAHETLLCTNAALSLCSFSDFSTSFFSSSSSSFFFVFPPFPPFPEQATCGVKTIIIDLKDDMAEGCFDIIQAQATYNGGYWNTTGIGRYVTCRGLVTAMKENDVDVLAHGATGRGNDQMRFERYTNVIAPAMKVYAPWRDEDLLKEFPGRAEMAAYLGTFGIEAFVGPKKKYSTDANLAGLSHEAEDLESLETPMLIVEPEMGVWPKDAPNEIEEVTLEFEHARCIRVNGSDKLSPQAVIRLANAIGGRNGIGLKHALENRIIGTKSRGVYEAPGMELLGVALEYLYQSVLDRRATQLFKILSQTISDQLYDGKFFDPTCRAAYAALDVLTEKATGTVKIGLLKGNIFFLSLTGVEGTIYNEAGALTSGTLSLPRICSRTLVGCISRPSLEGGGGERTMHPISDLFDAVACGSRFLLTCALLMTSLLSKADSSMEASDGLNPVSSQGYAEVQAVEALSLAAGKQINLRMPRPFKDVAPAASGGSA